MQINLGFFEFNNRSGYILKPRELRREGVSTSYTPFAVGPMDNIVVETIEVKVQKRTYNK
jgi:hypothetical protein